ncbi:MAG: single-stranded-DNA-specific exonuclease RecJ [Planctomycetota bacterium]|nr:single-stranded-DNA-specific exonuclease RecJ [Planctomycetota bacterium]
MSAEDGIAALRRDLDLPELVARLLWIRGQRTSSRARRFLSPRLADLSPPEGLPGVDQAADRLARALNAGERIAVCGDYDVDGMTGTSLLVRFLRLVDGDVIWSIPDRESDGYGLSPRAVDAIAEKGAKVAVTVDNGVTAHAALARARELGMDVVVTDHHLPDDTLPDCCALVNPHVDRGEAGEDEVIAPCGCALAFKLAWAVADRLRARFQGEGEERLRAFLRDAVGLVAMATVADAVPLVDENRILVAAGLLSLRRSNHPGIRALLDVSKVGALPLTTEDIGFKLGPRLNAAGRLSRPELVIELLTATDEDTAKARARALDQANRERRQIEQGVLEEAIAQAQARVEAEKPPALVVWGEGWHQGVIGIVASRLVDRFGLPTAVVGVSNGRGRGSCRTPPTVNLHDALADTADHLERFGGHAMAAGFEVRSDALEPMRAAFEAAVHAQLEGDRCRNRLTIDAVTGIDDWDLPAVQAVHRLAPFGTSNPEPVFLLEGVRVAGEPRLMGQASTHLAFALKQSGGAIRVVAFRRADLYDLVASGQPLDIAVTPIVNEWRGTRTPEFRLLDLKPTT